MYKLSINKIIISLSFVLFVSYGFVSLQSVTHATQLAGIASQLASVQTAKEKPVTSIANQAIIPVK